MEGWFEQGTLTASDMGRTASKVEDLEKIACIFMLALSLGDRPAAAGRIDARIWRVGIQQCS